MADGGVGTENSASLVVEDTKPNKDKPICRFYSKSGYCKFEEKCRFSHKDFKESSGASFEERMNEQSTLDNLPRQLSANENDNNIKKKRCRFFNTKGGCARGDGCKFAHVIKQDGKITTSTTSATSSTTSAAKSVPTATAAPERYTANTKATTTPLTTSTIQNTTTNARSTSPTTSITTTKPTTETKATNITTTQDTATIASSSPGSNNKNSQRPFATTAMLSSLDADQLAKLRTREIDQLMRRFGNNKAAEIPSNTGTAFSVIFTPSDPDWPFDVESVILEVMFPQDYPKKMFDAGLSQDQLLPLDLVRFVNQGIRKWIEQQQQIRDEKDTVELPFRPFLRWLDRNLEKLFIDAAKQMKEQEEFYIDDESLETNLPEEHFVPSHEKYGGPTFVGNAGSNPERYAGHVDSQLPENYYNYYDTNSAYTYEDYLAASNFENVDPNPGTYYSNGHQQHGKHYLDANNSNADRKDILLSDFMTFKSQPTKRQANHSKTSHSDHTMEKSTKDRVVFVDKESIENPSKGLVDSKTFGDDGDDDKDISELPSLEDRPSNNVPENSRPRGTEIRFKGLELCENTTTLRTEIVTLTVECAKCKTRTDIKADRTRPSSMRCEKCSNAVCVFLRPSMIHQYCVPTLGYLDLQGCHPFDLVMVDSSLIAGCLECSNETSVKGPQYGTNQVWCSKCHQKLQFKIESTRFIQLQPTASIIGDSHLPMPKRKPKPPGIREGFPLPENGTCKHYKKSFRWLRFPCCGKCYPCDGCHDEQESHDMKYASRMVCGFCSKEQPFSQGPCTACNSATTKAKTTHWEGGKGCRNKTMMSRGDDKKFKNTNKTVSRKAQGKATPGKTKSK